MRSLTMMLLSSFKYWGALVLLITTFAASRAQIVSEGESNRLDSLLIRQAYAGIADFFAGKEFALKNSRPSREKINNFQAAKEFYLSTIKNITAVNSLAKERIALLVDQNLKYAKDYDEALAGKQATDFYKNFMELAQGHDKSGALKNYYLAKHFYARHRRGILQWIAMTLDECRQKFAQKEYDEAYALVQQIEAKAKPASLLEDYRIEIKFLKRKIESELARIKTEREFFGQPDLPEHSWFVYAGGNFALHGRSKNVRWAILRLSTLTGDILEQYNYVFDARTRWGFGFSGEGIRAISRKLQIGINLIYNYYSYNITRIEGQSLNETFNYFLGYRAASLNLSYFFRPQVGLRPFLAFGGGMTQIKRKQLDEPRGIVYCCTPERVPEKQITTSFLTMDTGLDYVPRAKSRIVYKFFMGANYNLHPAQLLSRMTFASGFKIGVGF
jgi:hypothetical protein